MSSKVKENARGIKYRANNYVSSYKADIRKAYVIGYQQGFEDRAKLPKRKGAVMVASRGYGKGLRDRSKSDKIQRNLKN